MGLFGISCGICSRNALYDILDCLCQGAAAPSSQSQQFFLETQPNDCWKQGFNSYRPNGSS